MNIFEDIRARLGSATRQEAEVRRLRRERLAARRLERYNKIRELRAAVAEIYALLSDQRYKHYRTMLDELRAWCIRRLTDDATRADAAAQLKLLDYLIDYPDKLITMLQEDDNAEK